jgi:hypothetical protein
MPRADHTTEATRPSFWQTTRLNNLEKQRKPDYRYAKRLLAVHVVKFYNNSSFFAGKPAGDVLCFPKRTPE